MAGSQDIPDPSPAPWEVQACPLPAPPLGIIDTCLPTEPPSTPRGGGGVEEGRACSLCPLSTRPRLVGGGGRGRSPGPAQSATPFHNKAVLKGFRAKGSPGLRPLQPEEPVVQKVRLQSSEGWCDRRSSVMLRVRTCRGPVSDGLESSSLGYGYPCASQRGLSSIR